ncbi:MULTISPECIES: hypothetical protein [Actinomycetes]|uniref:hypothetical protein n=1 Tax=Actinomycetes TaxID=1760 RepID=UPI0034271E90
MIFTSRTYRVAIRRSIEREKQLRYELEFFTGCESEWRKNRLQHQINHTRKLQARKRKERK